MTLLPREPAPAPPKGYRPHMPKQVKLEACLIALGIDPRRAAFDHQPAIHERLWDENAGDTIPPANDPHFIVPSGTSLHEKKTAERDIPEIAKTRRLSKDQAAFRKRILAKTDPEDVPEPPKRKRWPSRPFRWRKP